jgi:predicted nucleic acid-binding protein
VNVVCNSTALVHLSAIGQLDLLRRLFQRVCIPEEVYREVVVASLGRPGAVEVQSADWIETRQVANQIALSLLQTVLGSGEAACIVLALEMEADLVLLDDRLARVQAQQQGLKVAGTVAVLMLAAERGDVDFPAALDDLLATGFRLSGREYQRVIDIWEATRQGE